MVKTLTLLEAQTIYENGTRSTFIWTMMKSVNVIAFNELLFSFANRIFILIQLESLLPPWAHDCSTVHTSAN